MNEELIKLLKEELKKAGLSEELANSIQITSKDQIEGVLKLLKPTQEPSLDLKKIVASQTFSEFLEKEGFDGLLKLNKKLQSNHDKKITDAQKKAAERIMKEFETGEGGEGTQSPTTPNQPNGDEMPEWAKGLVKRFDALDKEKDEDSKREQALSVLNGSKLLPDSAKKKWSSRINLDSDVSFEDQVKSLEEEYNEIHKGIVGDSAGLGLPVGGGSSKVSDQELDDVMDKI